MYLKSALTQRSQRRSSPFPHWEIDRPLTREVLHELSCAFLPHAQKIDDEWAIDPPFVAAVDPEHGIGRDNVALFPATGALIDELLSRALIEQVESMLEQRFHNAFLSISLVRDRETLARTVQQDRDDVLAWLLLIGPDTPTPQFPWNGDSRGYIFAASLREAAQFDTSGIAVDGLAVAVSYVCSATDWKLPSRRLLRAA